MRRLTLAFILLIALIAVGNGLVIWQFQAARLQTNRLTSAQQQLSAAFQLQVNVLSFHQTLRDLAASTDARRVSAESAGVRTTLRGEGLRIRTALGSLPANTPVDPALLPLMESIQATLPAQLEAINALTLSEDWTTIRRRLRDELSHDPPCACKRPGRRAGPASATSSPLSNSRRQSWSSGSTSGPAMSSR